jgi:pyrroloquinoline quinone biosynthesis protein B
LREENSIFRALEQMEDQAAWRAVSGGNPEELQSRDGVTLNFSVTPIALGGKAPGYSRKFARVSQSSNEMAAGLFIRSQGREIFVAPALPRIQEDWLAELDGCDAILIDGTFWSDDELIRTRGGGKTAREMGHLPISGAGGSLEALAKLKRTRKIFYHINNTNPILDEDSPEHAQARAAGWEIAYDGMEIKL